MKYEIRLIDENKPILLHCYVCNMITQSSKAKCMKTFPEKHLAKTYRGICNAFFRSLNGCKAENLLHLVSDSVGGVTGKSNIMADKIYTHTD